MFCTTCIQRPGHRSFAPEVIADGSGQWAGNGLRFSTEEAAAEWAKGLYSRWTLVREWRVVPSTDPVNQEGGVR